jgi:hypothetical protein
MKRRESNGKGMPKDTSNLARIATQTLQLLEKLKKATVGDRLSYADLSAVAGCPVQPLTKGYSYLYRARRIAELEGIFFSAIKKEDDFHGIQRISDSDALGLASRGRQMIRRRARLETRRLALNKGFEGFDQETKNLWNGHMTFFRVVEHVTKPSLVKSIQEVVVKNGQPLQIGESLELFR